jgi:hypothetical protein
VLVANYGSERPPLSDKRSYGCTTGKRGLCLVYNAAMKRELRARLDTDPGAPAPPACTLHSAAHTCFSGVCGRRTREHRTGSDREPQRRDAAPTEVTHIMVDEAQDMKPLFYLICRLVSMARSPPTLMLVGDPPTGGQSLERCGLALLTLAPRSLVRAAGRVWRVHALTVSSDARLGGRVQQRHVRAVGDLQPGRVGTQGTPSRCNMWRWTLTQGCSRCWTGCPKGLREDVLVVVPSAQSAVLQTLLAEQVHTYQPMRDDQGTKPVLVNRSASARTTPARAWSAVRSGDVFRPLLPLAGVRLRTPCRRPTTSP